MADDGRARKFFAKVYASIEAEGRGFLEAVVDAWGVVLVGLSLGLGLVGLGVGVHWPWHWVGVLIEHVGMGLVVSSIAILLYEWRADKRATLDLAKDLVVLLAAKGKESLKKVLHELLGRQSETLPETARHIASDCETLIITLADLLESRTRANDQYVSFVASLLKGVVTANAAAFSDLGRGRGEVRFSVPASAATLADDVLAAQMRALREGDRYDVISDLGSWRRDQLHDFHEATRQAVSQGVAVRRVFNLFLDEDVPLTSEEMKATLEKHLKAMTGWGLTPNHGHRYDARIFGSHERRELSDGPSDADLRKAHFGMFRLCNEDTIIRFRVTAVDLSEILISSDRDAIEKDSDLFERLWARACPLTSARIDALARERGGMKQRLRGNRKRKNRAKGQ